MWLQRLPTERQQQVSFTPGSNLYHAESIAHRLVEEFMLLANMSVAHRIYEHFPDQAVLRRHPPPQSRMLDELVIEILMIRCSR